MNYIAAWLLNVLVVNSWVIKYDSLIWILPYAVDNHLQISSISETQASHPLFADSASQSASPRYSLTDSPKARLNSNSGKTFSSYFSFGVRQYGNENEEEESESCPPKHGNGKNKAATMISSGQDKDSELHVSAKVEGDYDEGVKQIAELYR
ncbi:hypothetical protein YC2023_082331 [Brassica napus]